MTYCIMVWSLPTVAYFLVMVSVEGIILDGNAKMQIFAFVICGTSELSAERLLTAIADTF